MSWFTEIAGKAEDLLNRVDQTAATALQNASKPASHEKRNSYIDQNFDEQIYASNIGYSSPVKNFTSPSVTSNTVEQKAANTSNPLISRKKSESDDEKLLRFLNSEPLPTPTKRVKEKAIEKMEENKNSNLQSQATKTTEIENSNGTAEIVDIQDGSLTEVKSNSNENICNETRNNEENSSIENSDLKLPPIDKLVPMESSDSNSFISNEDLVLAQNRAQHAEAEMKRMSKKLEHWNSQISGNDKNVRELRERQKDMVAAMDAKDSQIAILKVRLQEADQELSTKLAIIEELKAENDRIIKEHAEGALAQNKTVQTLQQQLQEVEVEFGKTKDSLALAQTQHMQQFDKMEAEHRHLGESYSSLQKKWSELNEKHKDLSMQLKLSNSNLEAVQQEYNDYKQKAQRILQSKEKLISSLKEGNSDFESIEKNEASSLLLNAEIEAIKQEKDLLKDEIRRSNELVETYRVEMQELEKISQADVSASQERCKILKDSLDTEKTQKEEFLLLNNQLKEEVQLLREDFARNKNALQSRVQDREIEIEKLRRQLTAKSLSTVSQEELESRLHALTENLIQKQTIVEALSTEKNSLGLQLERLEQQLREAHSFNSQQHTFVGISSNEPERKSKAVFLDNPFDSTLTRRVKRVYGSLDSFSIRLGVFFRRYPASRVFVIIYMLLLHFWVLFVLLTYEPEVHSSGHENPQAH